MYHRCTGYFSLCSLSAASALVLRKVGIRERRKGGNDISGAVTFLSGWHSFITLHYFSVLLQRYMIYLISKRSIPDDTHYSDSDEGHGLEYGKKLTSL